MRPKLKHLRYQQDFCIALTYDDGLVAELDFRGYADGRAGEIIEPLADERFFSRVTIDHGVLTWPNGYDICPDVLRVWAEAGRVLDTEETNAHFAELLEIEPAMA